MPTEAEPAEAGEEPLTGSPAWAPQSVNPSVPNAARMYDYWLDGAHNFAADRKLADRVQQAMAAARDAVRINRAFLRRAVLFMIDSGVCQFLDIGAGVPTVGNVHEIAQRANPECRVVYVDKEPMTDTKALLKGNNRGTAIQSNLRDVEDILGHPETERLLDLDQPIGLLMLWVLHFVPDSWDPGDILARYRDRLAPGSHLAISHITSDGNVPGLEEVRRLYQDTPSPAYPRSHAEILRLFDGFELVEPGLVGSAYWRPSGPSDVSTHVEMNVISYGGVGRKP